MDFIGRWASPSSLRITILNATQDPFSMQFHPPYVGFSGLIVTVKESGKFYLSVCQLRFECDRNFR